MRARNIKPGFYKNEDLAECSPWARLLAPGLWMMADRAGRLEDRPKRIKGEIFPFDNVNVDELLDELAKWSHIIRYEADGVKYIQVLEFEAHQNPHVKEKQSTIPAPMDAKYNTSTVQAPDRHQTDTNQGDCQHPLNPESLLLNPENSASAESRDDAFPGSDSEETQRQPHEAVKWIEAFDVAGEQAFPNGWGITNRRMAPAGSDFTTANRLMALDGATLDGWAAFCSAKLAEMAARGKRPPGSLSYLETAYADHLQGLGEPIVGAAIAMTPDQIAKDAAREARMQAIREGRA